MPSLELEARQFKVNSEDEKRNSTTTLFWSHEPIKSNTAPSRGHLGSSPWITRYHPDCKKKTLQKIMADVINSKNQVSNKLRQSQILYHLISLSTHLFSTLAFFLHLSSLSLLIAVFLCSSLSALICLSLLSLCSQMSVSLHISISLLMFTSLPFHTSPTSLLNDNDSDHLFSQLSLCPPCQRAWTLALSLFGEKLARYNGLGAPAQNSVPLVIKWATCAGDERRRERD